MYSIVSNARYISWRRFVRTAGARSSGTGSKQMTLTIAAPIVPETQVCKALQIISAPAKRFRRNNLKDLVAAGFGDGGRCSQRGSTMKLENIEDQVIVITGATSGIGLTTARLAAEKGAKLMLIARNQDALRQLTDEINSKGGKATYFAADVAEEGSLRKAAEMTIQNFGRIDTWVNNAGGSIYGRILDVPVEDLRRLFETNVWGVVYGSRIAAEHMRQNGGALINLGSEVSDAPVPLQGMYSSSKHAVKGFTDALRMELEADGIPISVSLIKPTATHTPFVENAKNYLPYEPQLPSPVYAPDLVAEAILYCAENPVRDFYVGEMAKLHSSMATFAPRISEKLMELTIDSSQNSGEPARSDRPDGLYEPNSHLKERGDGDRFVLEDSVYQRAKVHPLVTAGLLLGGGAAVAAWIGSRKLRSDDSKAFGRADRKDLSNRAYSDILEHMEVVGSDDRHVGTVDRVEHHQLMLTKSDPASGGEHHLIPLEKVARVDEDRVVLSETAEGIRDRWSGSERKSEFSDGRGI